MLKIGNKYLYKSFGRTNCECYMYKSIGRTNCECYIRHFNVVLQLRHQLDETVFS